MRLVNLRASTLILETEIIINVMEGVRSCGSAVGVFTDTIYFYLTFFFLLFSLSRLNARGAREKVTPRSSRSVPTARTTRQE